VDRTTATGSASTDIGTGTRAVVLVEGRSDRAALETVAAVCGRELASEGVEIVAIGGAKNIRRALTRFGPAGAGVRVAGLCDDGEADDYRRALEWAGFGTGLTRDDLPALGFSVCVRDLEDELIRALGTARVERCIAVQGELESLRTLRQQPAQRDRTTADQLRRFMGTRSGRKLRYARLLAAALAPDQVPAPLAGVLAHV
jgi:hypothetical protein